MNQMRLMNMKIGGMSAFGLEHALFQIGAFKQVKKDRGKEGVCEPAREGVESRSRSAIMRGCGA